MSRFPTPTTERFPSSEDLSCFPDATLIHDVSPANVIEDGYFAPDQATGAAGIDTRESIRFTEKARDELEVDGLSAGDVIESIANAQAIAKTLRSRSRAKRSTSEKLYVIKSFSYDGTLIYTKGTIVR